MNNKHTDINDDEIRIISSDGNKPIRARRKMPLTLICATVITILAICAVTITLFPAGKDTEENVTNAKQHELPMQEILTAQNSAPREKAYTARKDTVAGSAELSILVPHNATATLEIGEEVSNDSTAVLIAQAADIRNDNGKIVGSYVVKGELVSKSEAKAGFCSIINGEISIGVSDATPMLEQALVSDGYFFRQYPLVVAGQIVENKPKGKSIRKALAEINGKICVIVSKDRLTFHGFSQALTDIGVHNAIYLVGGTSFGYYVTDTGQKITFGEVSEEKAENINYIVWR